MDWFQSGPIPTDIMIGTYDYKLVGLSYLIAVLASYVALDLVGRLRNESHPQARLYWLLGGSFAMGAGIWSMHFIGMLAFVMPMPMGYDLSWTLSSLLVAILASGFALFILRIKGRPLVDLVFGGILIGLGIATMHYMGMQGMAQHVSIHYLPGLFILSIIIAIIASEVALWLALQSNQGSSNKQFNLKILGAFVMGVAICGMHYTGMAAAIFSPLMHVSMPVETIQPTTLAFFIACITGLIIGLALTVSTYYKNMIKAVQNEKEFLNAMLDNLEDGIVACDANGKITVVNNVLQKNLVFTKKNHPIYDLSDYFDLYFSEDDKIALKKEKFPLFRALKGERIHAMELTMKFKTGVSCQVVIDGQPIMNAEGKKLGAVIVIHDVTEIKKTEKMKSEFVSIVSHELRTPLTSIRGSLGLILGGTVGAFSEKAAKLLDIANKNCERLLLLINDILDMEKIQANKMNFQLQAVDLNQLINEAISANTMYGKKFDVSVELTEFIPNINVHVDPDRLMQVLTNLISNAVKFSPLGGTVKLFTTRRDNYIRVSIWDRGPGIPKEFQSRIFQKFSQADSSTRDKSGTGLGLSISKAIIEKLGGTLNFSSSADQGTTFYVDIPIDTESVKTTSLVSDSQSDLIRKLLICEDDPDQAKYLGMLLESEGFHTDIAFTVADAKKLLAINNYEALLLDLILPDLDGITFIRELRKDNRTRTLPIIVLSVMAVTGHSILNGDAFLVVDWLEKPVNFSKLLQAISLIKPHTSLSKAHILHVEDDEDIQHVIADLLEKEATVIAASSIQETKNKLAKEVFDLVILDLLLPDGNGAELLPLLASYELPIIVYSAFDLDQEYATYVKQALNKSKTTNEKLLSTIVNLLQGATKEKSIT